MSYECIDLCGIWKFQPDPSQEGEKAGFFDPEYNTRFWREVRLPCDFETCHPGLESYEGAGWFRRAMDVPASWKGSRIVIRFEGVNYHAKVWVNSRAVGESLDGFLPFEFPIQDLLYFDSKDTVAVKADNLRREGEVPGLQRGWRTFGGILREVELIAMDLLYLDHIRIVAEPLEGGGELSLKAVARNEHAQAVEAEILARIMDKEGKTLAEFKSQPATLPAYAKTTFLLDGRVDGVNPWWPEEPSLYTAKVELLSNGQTVGDRVIRFGFRKIQSQGGELLLNGRPIYLTGFNRHEDSPRRNMATDLETARRDIIDMKSAGANFVRLCHYPHHPGELDLCDELGLLVMGEIPLYWWNGSQEKANCAKKLEAAKRQLKTMIQRDINHPSIIFWSVSNENEEWRHEVVSGNRELVQLAKELDPTRLAVHVSCHWQRDPHFEDDDVVCVNSYPSLDRRGYGGNPDYDLCESTQYWRESLRQLHEQYPQNPILITEFGYASFEGVYGSGFGEDTQSLAIEREFAGMDAPYICGATIWCWADHPWPPATFPFCYHLGLSPYGVVTRERRKLKAYWTVRRLFREKRGIQEKPRPSSPGTGVTMIRLNLSNIPYIPFPEGFSIRPMQLDEAGVWTDIERDAERYFGISDNTFYNEFGRDLQATQWRSFLIIDGRGVAVGTISAWYNREFKGEDYGQIHWIAVRPAYQGRGLGKAALSYALRQLARWHDRCFLGTSTERLPAIKLYLDFGFIPDLDSPQEVEKWIKVRDSLKHPALEKIH